MAEKSIEEIMAMPWDKMTPDQRILARNNGYWADAKVGRDYTAAEEEAYQRAINS